MIRRLFVLFGTIVPTSPPSRLQMLLHRQSFRPKNRRLRPRGSAASEDASRRGCHGSAVDGAGSPQTAPESRRRVRRRRRSRQRWRTTHATRRCLQLRHHSTGSAGFWGSFQFTRRLSVTRNLDSRIQDRQLGRGEAAFLSIFQHFFHLCIAIFKDRISF